MDNVAILKERAEAETAAEVSVGDFVVVEFETGKLKRKLVGQVMQYPLLNKGTSVTFVFPENIGLKRNKS